MPPLNGPTADNYLGVPGPNIKPQSGYYVLEQPVDGLVAHAGGGQANGTPITQQMARFVTVATIADSGLLPASVPGLSITVTNAAANSMNVFPNGTDQVNALGASTAFALAGGKTASFNCYTAGQWHTILSA